MSRRKVDKKKKVEKALVDTLRKVLVDIDYKPNMSFFYNLAEKVAFIERFLPVRFELQEIAETKKGLHIYFRIEPECAITPYEIIIFQLILGSDYKREVFNLKRAMDWWNGDELTHGLTPQWNTLYKYKFEKGKLVSHEKTTPYTIEATRVFRENLKTWRKIYEVEECREKSKKNAGNRNDKIERDIVDELIRGDLA